MTTMCPALALILLFAVEPQVRLGPDRHTVTADVRACVAAPMHAVARELLEPARLPEWLPGLTATQPLPKGFAAEWHLPWPLGHVYEVVHAQQHFEGTDLVVSWKFVRGDLWRHEVQWRLRAIAPDETEVIYAGTVRFRRWVPGFLLRAAQRRAIPEALRRLERRARETQHEEVPRWTRITERSASPRS